METNKDTFIVWKTWAPWLLTIFSLGALICIYWFLNQNINWFKSSVFSDSLPTQFNDEYKFYAFHMHTSMVRRSIGLFSGFALMFIGLSVVFYTIKGLNEVKAESNNLKLSLITASPGLVSVFVGAFLIAFSISNKDTFPGYSNNPNQSELRLDPNNRPSLPSK